MLFLGRLSLHKADLFPFVPVFKSLVGENASRRLLWVIAGTEDASYSSELRKYSRTMAVDRHVRVMLDISDDTKRMLIPAADVFISPVDSVQESFGLTAVEAMACGVPQVVADWNGYRDTVSHGETGFLVPTYWTNCHRDLTETGAVLGPLFDQVSLGQSVAVDLNKFREYLQCLIDNETLRGEMACRSRQRALNLFSFESVVRQYEALWRELAAIASGLKARASSAMYDRPLYYDFFGHYASKRLVDETPLRITQQGRAMASANDYVPRLSGSAGSLNVLAESLLRRALMEVGSLDGAEGLDDSAMALTKGHPTQLGDFVRSLSENGRLHPDYVCRHVMWLIKYGLIEPLVDSYLPTQISD